MKHEPRFESLVMLLTKTTSKYMAWKPVRDYVLVRKLHNQTDSELHNYSKMMCALVLKSAHTPNKFSITFFGVEDCKG